MWPQAGNLGFQRENGIILKKPSLGNEEKKLLKTHHYLILFLSSNLILDYLPVSIAAKLWVLLLGVLLPLGIGLFQNQFRAASRIPLGSGEIFPAPSRWVWWIPCLLAVLVRLANLGGAWGWPSGDQSLTGMIAVELTQKWNWNLFQTFGQIPTFYSRFVYGLLQVTHLPLFSLYFPNALFSILALGIGWKAARQYFSTSFSLLLIFLFFFDALSLRFNRLAYPIGPLMLWELAVLYSLGRLLKTGKTASPVQAFLLGALCGCGPYMGPQWPVLWLWVLGVLALTKKKIPLRAWLALGLSTVLFLSPFIFSILGNTFGGHISKIAVWSGFISWADQWRTWAAYLQILLGPGCGDSYTPSSQGFYNFILVAFFYVGLLEGLRWIRFPLIWAIGFGFFLAMLPGLLTINAEGFRMALVVPFFMVFTGWGIQAFLAEFPKTQRIRVLFLVLGLSALLNVDDFFQLHQRLFRVPGAWIQTEQQISYKLLNPLAKDQGPGNVFWGWGPEIRDFSLAYASYPFNAAENSRWDGQKTSWTALLTQSHYLPWLQKRFPQSQWNQIMIPGKGWAPLAIGLFPDLPGTEAQMDQWKAFNYWMQSLDLKIMDQSNGVSRRAILEEMLAFYPHVPSDPYLQSCFFEKLAFNYSCEQAFHPEDTWVCWANFSDVFQNSFNRGIQDAELKDQFWKLTQSDAPPAQKDP